MPILESELSHWIDHFYGYGSWKSRFWFISHEEPGGDFPEEVGERIRYFTKVKSPDLCDIRDLYAHVAYQPERAHAAVFSNLYDYRFGPSATLNTVWKNLISFEFGCSHQPLPDLLDYQRTQFAEIAREREALIPLYPLPSTHNHAWYYSWLQLKGFDFLRTRQRYEQHLYQTRMTTILDNIQRYHPEAVVMFAMNNINNIKQSICGHFENVKFTTIKAIPLQIPGHHRATINGTRVMITTLMPALKHNRKETGFDWYECGKQFGMQ